MNQWFFIHFAQHLQQTSDDLSFEWLIDPQQQVFLQHHIFSGQCLVPAAISTELCIQAAMQLALITPPSDTAQTGYPKISIESFNIKRPLALGCDEQIKLFVSAIRLPDNGYKVSLRRHLYHANGKLLRRDVLVAQSVIRIETAIHLPNNLHIGTLVKCAIEGPCKHFDFGQANYYKLINPSHGELFQSLTGKCTLSNSLQWLISEFNIQAKEQHYSCVDELPFVCSPLAIDSVLQACVLSCIQIESVKHQQFLSKLPVALNQVQFFQPFQFNHRYQCVLNLVALDDQTQTLRAWVKDQQGQLVAYFDRITLHRAPNEPRLACQFERDYRHFLLTDQQSKPDVEVLC
ncbi:polyketide synthase dehydratase domain-containing protein [Motilimonas cestriensis]|uniref:Polyketide synthase dehydratase domain-containing protein n=1 Tax=Motilimonas cestriensis TaxID=2742685 RepID=A0ABS8WC93_9GAMM|nr:polyketide synthase dehydratase domain-containing protein [Motilimonas cestriensis]MCE2595226.1 polyketide synthase dehydratase domain-containing protein [Motilimonas cestriensis]